MHACCMCVEIGKQCSNCVYAVGDRVQYSIDQYPFDVVLRSQSAVCSVAVQPADPQSAGMAP